MNLMKRFQQVFLKKEQEYVHTNYIQTSDSTLIESEIIKNKNLIIEVLKDSQDLKFRQIYLPMLNKHCLMVFFEGMVDKDILNKEILEKLMSIPRQTIEKLEEIENYLSVSEVSIENVLEVAINQLLLGNTLIFVEGVKGAIVIGSNGWEKRSIQEPPSEQTIRGSREGFVECLQTNITLIRKRIKDPRLAVEFYKVGRRSDTRIAIVYLKGVINQDIVEEVKSRLSKIDMDGVIGSAQIEDFIENNKWTIFPQLLASERPDRIMDGILEGRLSIIVDGTPFLLIAPVTFTTFLKSPDDIYERAIVATTLRMTRYIGYFLSSSLPALYIAITAYHPGMLPTQMALAITDSRIGLPIPVFLEALFMEFTLVVLTEASIRLPRAIALTVGIVGGLVIGQAAVQAGILSPILVIVIAITAITSYTIPIYSYALSNRMLRLPLMLLSGIFGLYGFVMGWIFIIIHLASLESFGVRYLSDFSPYKLEKLKDTFIKLPQIFIRKRPEVLDPVDVKRQN
ncbi:spore germination protein [Bacillus timonensis]|nr:spore germination protein [Bacillus timonensis]